VPPPHRRTSAAHKAAHTGAAAVEIQAQRPKQEKTMTIGIIGAGALGKTLAKALAGKGVKAVISNSRGPESLAPLVEELGPHIRAVTTDEAAKADIVVLGVHWATLPVLLKTLPAWNGRIVIDASNPLEFLAPDAPDRTDPNNPFAVLGVRLADLGGRVSSEIVAELVPGARVVKAFNHFGVPLLLEPDVAGGQRVLFYSGDDASAKDEVRQLIEALGFFPVDLGTLKVGGAQTTPLGPLSMTSFVKI
jgi:predicted dinucleotide-binding enzyme